MALTFETPWRLLNTHRRRNQRRTKRGVALKAEEKEDNKKQMQSNRTSLCLCRSPAATLTSCSTRSTNSFSSPRPCHRPDRPRSLPLFLPAPRSPPPLRRLPPLLRLQCVNVLPPPPPSLPPSLPLPWAHHRRTNFPPPLPSLPLSPCPLPPPALRPPHLSAQKSNSMAKVAKPP